MEKLHKLINTVIITVLYQTNHEWKVSRSPRHVSISWVSQDISWTEYIPICRASILLAGDDEGLFYMFQQAPLGSKEANYASRLREIPFLVAASYQQAETTEPYGVIHSCRGSLIESLKAHSSKTSFNCLSLPALLHRCKAMILAINSPHGPQRIKYICERWSLVLWATSDRVWTTATLFESQQTAATYVLPHKEIIGTPARTDAGIFRWRWK